MRIILHNHQIPVGPDTKISESHLPASLQDQITGLRFDPLLTTLNLWALRDRSGDLRYQLAARIKDAASELEKAQPMKAPPGYDPKVERFSQVHTIVSAKTGLLSESYQIDISYKPPSARLFRSSAATLRATLMAAEVCIPLQPVEISAPGQLRLSSERGWHHERICLEAARYLRMVCSKANALAKERHLGQTYIDFEAEYEMRLVSEVAFATNLLQLPNYYVAALRYDVASELRSGATTLRQALGEEFDAEWGTLMAGVSEAQKFISSADVRSELEGRLKAEIDKVVEEARQSAAGLEVARLIKVKERLESKIAILEGKTAKLEQRKRACFGKPQLVAILRDYTPGRCPQPVITHLLDALAASCEAPTTDTGPSPHVFKSMMSCLLDCQSFQEALKDLLNSRSNTPASRSKLQKFLSPSNDDDKGSGKVPKKIQAWKDQVQAVTDTVRFLATECSPEEARLFHVYIVENKCRFSNPREVLDAAKAFLQK